MPCRSRVPCRSRMPCRSRVPCRKATDEATHLVAVLISALKEASVGEGNGEMRFCGVLRPLAWLSCILKNVNGSVCRGAWLWGYVKERDQREDSLSFTRD